MRGRRIIPAGALAWALVVSACGSDPLEGRACVTNQDCAAGEQCVGGACLGSNAGCSSDLECGAGEACDLTTGACEAVAPLACSADAECPEGQRCNTLTGVCIDIVDPDPGTGGNPTCRSDLECSPPSTVCQSGQCAAGCGQPGTTISCGSGEVCDGSTGRCAPATPSCTTDAECGAPARICEMSMCVPGCNNGGSCAMDEVCDTTTGRCQPVQGPCTRDAECGPPALVCEGGQCVGGCAEPGGVQCAGNETCNPTTGRCDPAMTPGCTTDQDCNPPSTICDMATGTCAAGCGVSGCPTGQMCDASTGRCQMTNPGGGGSTPLNGMCTGNADCQSGVCFDFGPQVGRMCVAACASSLDCPSGFTCGDYLGAKTCLSARFFQSATFTAANGATCSRGGECRSGFCRNNSVCVDTCAEDGDCSGSACLWEEIVPDVYLAACSGPGRGTGTNGSTCSSDADCRSGVCYGSGICGELCGATADCPGGSVCAPVNYSVCLAGLSSCLQWQVNLVKACVQVPAGNIGTGAIGSPCTAGADCRDGFCDTQAGVCTGACSRDADCPSNMRCGIEQYGTLGSDPVYFNACITP